MCFSTIGKIGANPMIKLLVFLSRNLQGSFPFEFKENQVAFNFQTIDY
jgi:hypothetical protein